jgi:hypothetical protein
MFYSRTCIGLGYGYYCASFFRSFKKAVTLHIIHQVEISSIPLGAVLSQEV